MDLETTYLGLKLENPFIAGASPLCNNLDAVRRLEDAGAAALVLPSLFEEEVENEQFREEQDVEAAENSYAEALTYLPQLEKYRNSIGLDAYLGKISKIKEAASIPVIASLNGTSPEALARFGRACRESGADALELNIYFLTSDPEESAEVVERRILAIVETVKATASLPVAVKLSPFFSALPNMVVNLEKAGADGVVLFNRFYQPDFDIEMLNAWPSLKLSSPSELLLRLRWTAILSGRVNSCIAVSGGVHSETDAIKAIMAGAHAVQVVSCLIMNGPEYLKKLRQDTLEWLNRHECESLAQIRGSLGHSRIYDPSELERINYIHLLKGGVKMV